MMIWDESVLATPISTSMTKMTKAWLGALGHVNLVD